MLTPSDQADGPFTQSAGGEQQPDGDGFPPSADEVGAASRGVYGRDVARDDPVLGADSVVAGHQAVNQHRLAGRRAADRGSSCHSVDGACSILDRHQNVLGSWDPTLRRGQLLAIRSSPRAKGGEATCAALAAWRQAGCCCACCRRATTSPAFQPGARPPSGGWIDSGSKPLLVISHAITELEFHISPPANSSRPHTGVGREGTKSSNRRAHAGSSVSRRGLSTASPTSGITPSRQRRTS